MENLRDIQSLSEFRSKSGGNFWLEVVGDRFDQVLEKWHPEYRGDWRILEGAKVLDLGCGTAWPDSCHVYEPYFCRLAGFNGADVTGVDRFQALDQDLSEFHCIQGDFVDAIARGQLKDLLTIHYGFDIIHMWRLWETDDPFMRKSLEKANLTLGGFIRLLGPQAYPLMVEGGLLAAEDQFVWKTGCEFVKV